MAICAPGVNYPGTCVRIAHLTRQPCGDCHHPVYQAYRRETLGQFLGHRLAAMTRGCKAIPKSRGFSPLARLPHVARGRAVSPK